MGEGGWGRRGRGGGIGSIVLNKALRKKSKFFSTLIFACNSVGFSHERRSIREAKFSFVNRNNDFYQSSNSIQREHEYFLFMLALNLFSQGSIRCLPGMM